MRQCAAPHVSAKRVRCTRMSLLTAKRLFVPLALLCLGACLVAACAEDEQEEETHHEAAPDCQAILDVCTHDVTGELAGECHELAHGNDAAECAERKDECVDFCSSAMGE